jgi:hypothetical protein
MTEPVLEITLPAPRGRVWQYFRDPELISHWHGWETDDLEDEIRIIYADEAEVVEEQRVLHLGGHLFEFGDAGPATAVTVTRTSPLVSATSFDWHLYYDDIDEGWRSFLEQLRFALSHHPGERRRTVHLGGTAVSPAPEAPLIALGLPALEAGEPGDTYEGITVFEEGLSGEIWFRTALQIGLTVDNWGPGLLVLATAPNAEPLHSAAAVTLITYGLPDIHLLEDRWSEWWQRHYRQ